MKKYLLTGLVLSALLVSQVVQAASIKLAIIAPEGSAWSNVMKEMGAELKS